MRSDDSKPFGQVFPKGDCERTTFTQTLDPVYGCTVREMCVIVLLGVVTGYVSYM